MGKWSSDDEADQQLVHEALASILRRHSLDYRPQMTIIAQHIDDEVAQIHKLITGEEQQT